MQGFRDFVPEGEDTGGYGDGKFKDWVPEGEELPAEMTGNGLTIKTAEELAAMPMPELVAYAKEVGYEGKTTAVKKAVLAQGIVDHLAAAGNPAPAETEEEVDEEDETGNGEESEGDTDDEEPEVPGLDENV